jgi:hypothetical protein
VGQPAAPGPGCTGSSIDQPITLFKKYNIIFKNIFFTHGLSRKYNPEQPNSEDIVYVQSF